MHFKTLLLENFGPHHRREFAFHPRLTGILGRNGAGKTTILDALEYTLTGVIPRAGTKEENIRHGAGPKEASRIVAHLEHGPHAIEVVRGLRRAKTQISIDGGTPIEGDAKVNAELDRLLGAARPLLANYVFVRQRRIADFLDETPAKRADALAALFGLERAALAWDAAGRALRGLEVRPPAVGVDELRRQAGDDREAIAALRDDRRAYADLDGYDPEADPDRATLRDADRVREAAAARVEAARTLALMESAEQAALAAVGEATARLEEADAALRSAEADAEGVDRDLEAWRRVDAAATERTRCDNLAAALAADHAAHPRPARPAGWIASDANRTMAREQADARRVAVVAMERFLEVCDREGATACPTCGTSIAELLPIAAEYRRELPDLRALLAETDARLAVTARHDAELAAWQQWREFYKSRYDELQASLAAIPAVDEPARDREACAAARREARTLRSARDRALGEAHAATRRHSDRVAAVAAARARLEALPAVEPPDDAALAGVRARVGELDLRLARRRELATLIRERKSALAVREEAIARAAAADRASAGARRAAGYLEGLRGLFHAAALPRAAARDYMALLESGINEILAGNPQPFRVRTTENLSFEARFADGSVQPVLRISSGQKVMLALAFRAQVNSLFTGSVGLLTLDEPTDSLDVANLACLDAAIARLRAVSDARGLQCLIVTHDARLSRLFDTTVDLS